MNAQTQQQLIAYLEQHVTQNKREKIAELLQHRTRHVGIVIEDIFQPHNASAVLRSAECFGIQDVHVVERRNRFRVNSGVAMGASKWLNLQRYQSTQQCYDTLKKDGYRIVATTPHADAVSIHELPLDKKCVLVFGTENTGLTDQAFQLADEYVTIPMFGFTESFNISVSVALCLHTIAQRLHESDIDWRLTPAQKQDVHLSWLRAIIRGHAGYEKQFYRDLEL